jgi:hypothetical protein
MQGFAPALADFRQNLRARHVNSQISHARRAKFAAIGPFPSKSARMSRETAREWVAMSTFCAHVAQNLRFHAHVTWNF